MESKQAIQAAVQHHRAGQLMQARRLYQQILCEDPNHADALHMLGVLEIQTGNYAAAVDLIRKAISLSPSLAAIAQTHSNLAKALRHLGKLADSIAAFREAVRLNPNLLDVRQGLGEALMAAGQFEEAISFLSEIVRLQPERAGNHLHLADALNAAGKLDDAIASYRQAIQIDPNLIEARNNLGNALQAAARLDEAIVTLQRAVQLRPDYAEAHSNLGNACCSKGRLDDAVAAFGQAIRLKTDFAKAHNNLGTALKDMGQLDDAIAAYRKAIDLDPNYHRAHSNLLYALHFHPGWDPKSILEEHRRWNEAYARGLVGAAQPHANDRNPDRPLRIGFVSPNFCLHPVGRFLLPILRSLDRVRFRPYCYSDVLCPDDMTASFRGLAAHWRDTAGLTDQRLAGAIREDRVDILFDLAMHMAGSRMLLFARKPAPVQVTYLAYCSTTGLDAMDYRLTDPHLDPPGSSDGYYSEQSIRLPETYWCFEPAIPSLQVGALPAIESGHITFGCLNNFCKVSQPALELWMELLQAVPSSKLIVHAKEGSHRRRLLDLFKSRELDQKRLSFCPKLSLVDYLNVYNKIDIALDPFPCNGGTTTCDAFWMGVPVVTLAGNSGVGRGGVSVLTNLGLGELIAQTPRQYLQIARDLAFDVSRLSLLRHSLRKHMEQSPLMNGRRFGRNFGAACREMWQSHCAVTFYQNHPT